MNDQIIEPLDDQTIECGLWAEIVDDDEIYDAIIVDELETEFVARALML